MLVPGGTLFGATILGRGVEYSRLGRGVVELSNRRGVLSNCEDDAPGLDAALDAAFPSHGVEVVGVVALFSARAPA